MSRYDREWRRRTLILAALRDGYRYAYPLSRRTGIRAGRLYPELYRLEREGLVVGETEDSGRRAYSPVRDGGQADD